jgi:hypothetical protein
MKNLCSDIDVELIQKMDKIVPELWKIGFPVDPKHSRRHPGVFALWDMMMKEWGKPGPIR